MPSQAAHDELDLAHHSREKESQSIKKSTDNFESTIIRIFTICSIFAPFLFNNFTMSQTKIIQLIHLAFCIAVFSFGALAIMITHDKLFIGVDFENGDPLTFIAPFFAVISILISNVLFNTLIGKIDPESGTAEKVMLYQTAFLVKCDFFLI